jgi:hypothetical protein
MTERRERLVGVAPGGEHDPGDLPSECLMRRWCPDRGIRLIVGLGRSEFRDLKDTSKPWILV